VTTKAPVPRSLRPARRVFRSRLRAVHLSLLLAIAPIVQGCATSEPQPIADMWQRAQTQTKGALTVTVSVPTLAEAAEIYGVDLAERDIQAVWVEVRNDASAPYWFLSSGLDPNYFSASEAAYAFRSANEDGVLEQRFRDLRFRNPIMPGSTVSGYVLANLDEGVKFVQVDLITRNDAKSFTFLTLDPTFKGVSREIRFDALYRDDELIRVDDEQDLRARLEQLPCCTTNKNGSENGDPLNLVLIGTGVDIAAAAIRRQWHPTEVLSSESIWRSVTAFLEKSRYRYSPISPLFVYGRPQDMATQKVRTSINERNHARFWLSPIRFRGKEVWVGQISRDIGVKFTLKSPTISTHVIDPDVDEVRRYFAEDLAYSQSLSKIGFVKGVGEAPYDAPRMNLVGDPWYSDGLRAVMFLEPRPQTLSEVEILNWEQPGRLRTVAKEPAVGRGHHGQP
jgi:hypothetical protein